MTRWMGTGGWRVRVLAGVTMAASLAASIAAAQGGPPAPPPAPPPATPPGTPAAAPAVTRAELAARLLAVDARYSAADSLGTLSDSARAQVNRVFDRASLFFFGGRYGQTVLLLDSVTTALGGSPVAAPVLPSTVIGGEPARVVRERLLARLAAVDSAGPLAGAVLAARARARLLVDTLSPERGAEFLSQPAALAAAVTREVAALERGRNPYAKAVGDRWTAYRGAGGTMVPLRVIAPPAAASKPVGVLIALHGAGGDENMFPDSYGRGIAARLATAAGLLFVSPSTTAFMRSPEQFDSLLVALQRDYRLDPTRVYALGHSLGAGAAARLAQQRPAALAAVACLAGGSAVTAAGAPPLLFIGASLDPIAAPRGVQAAAAGTPTGRYEERPNEGHLLMMRGALQRAIPWLLTHRREAAR